MRRIKGVFALLLTAFFAVAGAYHDDRLPRPSHDHAGLCTDTSAVPEVESCGICHATQTAADRLAVIAVAGALDQMSPLTVTGANAPASVIASLLPDDRAPPVV